MRAATFQAECLPSRAAEVKLLLPTRYGCQFICLQYQSISHEISARRNLYTQVQIIVLFNGAAQSFASAPTGGITMAYFYLAPQFDDGDLIQPDPQLLGNGVAKYEGTTSAPGNRNRRGNSLGLIPIALCKIEAIRM
jgi:hypothetical protein